MKRYNLIKTIQLIGSAIYAITCMIILDSNKDLHHLIGTDPRFRLVCYMLWFGLGMFFVFLFVDLGATTAYKRMFSEMDYRLFSDPNSGLANRLGCDTQIERYVGAPLPPDMTCIVLELTSIFAVNNELGHERGNILLRDFSGILHTCAEDLCFVGRNGGNKYLAFFDPGRNEDVLKFITQIEHQVEIYNEHHSQGQMVYSYGLADSPAATDTIFDLIGRANRDCQQRSSKNED